jgi:hypothetical protein
MTLPTPKIAAAALLSILLWGGLSRRVHADESGVKLTTSDGSTQFGIQNAGGTDVMTVNSLGGVVIGSSITVSSNTVLPGTTFYQNGSAVIGGSGQSVTLSSNVIATGGIVTLGSANNYVKISSNTILPGTTFYQNGQATFGSIFGGGAIPGTVTRGNGCGTTGSVSITAGGTTAAGVVNCTPAGTISASAAIVTVTPVVPAPNSFVCVVSPNNANAEALAAGAWPVVTGTQTQWVLTAGATKLASGTAYAWTYICSGY